MKFPSLRVGATLFILTVSATARAEEPAKIIVGSASDTESRVVAEILARGLETSSLPVERAPNVTRSLAAREALLGGRIDLAPDDLASLGTALLGAPDRQDRRDLLRALEKSGLVMTDSLGFESGFVLAIRRSVAEGKSVRTLAELNRLSPLRGAFSPEFVSRSDGLSRLREVYGVTPGRTETMEHAAALAALDAGRADVIDLRRVDPAVDNKNFLVLSDDQHAFPGAPLVILARADWADKTPLGWAAARRLENQLSTPVARHLIELADAGDRSIRDVADIFVGSLNWKRLAEQKPPDFTLPPPQAPLSFSRRLWRQIARLTMQQLGVVSLSLLLAIAVGLPLAAWAERRPPVASTVLAVALVFETLPGIALLCLLLPTFGPTTTTAVIAAALCALAPLLNASHRGFVTTQADAIHFLGTGLSAPKFFLRVRLPLAAPALFSGLRRAAVIAVSVSTVAGMMGAGGGYGTLIAAGVALGDVTMILRGAAPAAVMAFALRWIIEAVDLVAAPALARLTATP